MGRSRSSFVLSLSVSVSVSLSLSFSLSLSLPLTHKLTALRCSGQAGRAVGLPRVDLRPRIYVYDLPPQFNVRLLQYRGGRRVCTHRQASPDTFIESDYGAETGAAPPTLLRLGQAQARGHLPAPNRDEVSVVGVWRRRGAHADGACGLRVKGTEVKRMCLVHSLLVQLPPH